MRLLPPPRIDAFILVSIHAPVKDATRNIQATILELLGFNPRTRKGCDIEEDYNNLLTEVSIHAPVKDATD